MWFGGAGVAENRTGVKWQDVGENKKGVENRVGWPGRSRLEGSPDVASLTSHFPPGVWSLWAPSGISSLVVMTPPLPPIFITRGYIIIAFQTLDSMIKRSHSGRLCVCVCVE